MKIIYSCVITTLFVAIHSGCIADQTNLQKQDLKQHKIPPGVDSLIAINADSAANLYFVDQSQRMKSNYYYNQSKKLYELCDSLWYVSDNVLDTTRQSVTVHDSLLTIKLYNKCLHYLKKQEKKRKDDKLILPERKKIQSTCLEIIRRAKVHAENSRLINPYNLNARLNLIQTLMLLGKISGDLNSYLYAIQELIDFLQYEKSKDNIYSLLAESYYAVGDWKNAFENFYYAQQVLEKTAIFQEHSSSIQLDTTKLVYYLQQQGDCKTKLYDDQSALQLLANALKLTTATQKKKEIHKYITWINWDDGNILAVEKRDYIYDLYYKKKYKKANSEFKKLLKILKTQRTKNQINWKIATIDFTILNKKNEGIERLFRVIKSIPPENIADSTALLYLTDYGAMCYTLGGDYLDKKKNKIAYAYFKQGAQINWEKRGECYFRLAKLSQTDSDETIKNCQLALTYKDYLSGQIINQTYELLVDAYKRNGNFKLARQYYNSLTQLSY